MPMNHYGYSGKTPAPSTNKNVELLLQNLMLEAELELEQKSSEHEENSADVGNDMPANHQEIVDDMSVPSLGSHLILPHFPPESMPVAEQSHKPHRTLPQILTSEPEEDFKPHLDKKA